MKKILCIFVLMLLMMQPVLAVDNKLYLTEKDNKIYYDEDLFNKDEFMHHLDMIPGGKYQDDLIIENGAKIPLKLYLQVKEEEQNDDAEELLDSIYMKVTLNDTVIYDGKVKGLDYNANGVNLQDSVFLKEFSVDESAKIHVDLYLDSAYSNKEFTDYSYLNWVFIAQFDKNDNPEVIEVVPAPITGINKNYVPIVIASVGLCIVGCIIIILAKRKKSN
ncbi:MAG: hypothetical protein IJR82_01535 [Bacilli bacterium]|nr:hypothetical protein [Bacilli bacterium]